MTERRTHSDFTAVRMLGRRWALEILEQLSLNGPARFTELRRGIDGMSEHVMGRRLRELTEVGYVSRDVRPERPVVVSYGITSAGERAFELVRQIEEQAQRVAA